MGFITNKVFFTLIVNGLCIPIDNEGIVPSIVPLSHIKPEAGEFLITIPSDIFFIFLTYPKSSPTPKAKCSSK